MITRRIPIDFDAISKETGVKNGTIARHSAFGWVVRDNSCPPTHTHLACITPPEMMPDETSITIDSNHWCFHKD